MNIEFSSFLQYKTLVEDLVNLLRLNLHWYSPIIVSACGCNQHVIDHMVLVRKPCRQR